MQSKETSRSKEAAAENRALSRQVEELQAEMREHAISRSKSAASLFDENMALMQQVSELQEEIQVHAATKTRFERQESIYRDEAVKNKTQLEALRLEVEDLRRCVKRHS